MSKLPSQYKNVTLYKVITIITVRELLDRKDYYHNCYYVEDEKDDPMAVRDSLHYLRNQSSDKLVYILKYDTCHGEFTELTMTVDDKKTWLDKNGICHVRPLGWMGYSINWYSKYSDQMMYSEGETHDIIYSAIYDDIWNTLYGLCVD